MSLKRRLGIVISFDSDLLSHVMFTRLHWDRRFAGPFQDGLVTREPLVPINDDVTVKRVEFHQERIATTLLGTDHRRATTAEEVEQFRKGAKATMTIGQSHSWDRSTCVRLLPSIHRTPIRERP